VLCQKSIPGFQTYSKENDKEMFFEEGSFGILGTPEGKD
jgi:hypothetical protein